MSGRRVVIIGTAGAVAALAVMLAVVRWDDANKVAVVISALAAVAAIGVGICAAPAGASSGGGSRVSRTGRATAGRGGWANTGVSGPAGSLPAGVRVDRTGDADAPDGGDANTGIRLN